LIYESRTWWVNEKGVRKAGARETGFWHPGSGPDDVELALATVGGPVAATATSLTGRAGDAQWELESHISLAAERRFYAVIRSADGTDVLAYACEQADAAGLLQPSLNARLDRVAAGLIPSN
jgi:hypothetical protein